MTLVTQKQSEAAIKLDTKELHCCLPWMCVLEVSNLAEEGLYPAPDPLEQKLKLPLQVLYILEALQV